MVYGTYGHLNAARDNVVLLPSHYMADCHGYEWLIGPDRALDTSKLFLVATELFGNGHSSSPSNTPEPFHGPRFPVTTIRDNRVWSESTIDLTRWRGSTVQIYFTVFNDGQGSTAGMYLDDVSVQGLSCRCHAVATPASGATPSSVRRSPDAASPTHDHRPSIPVADTATPSAPSAPGVPPAGCVDLLQNGGFEELLAGWVPGRDPVPVQIVDTPVHSGTYSLELGEDT